MLPCNSVEKQGLRQSNGDLHSNTRQSRLKAISFVNSVAGNSLVTVNAAAGKLAASVRRELSRNEAVEILLAKPHATWTKSYWNTSTN